jgi:ribosomal-protein-alanine N-acetyltransferase
MVIGTWSGILDTGAARLRLKFIISGDGTATLFSLDQGGKPIRGTMGAERVGIEFPSLGGSFVGRRVAAERIDGFWLQNGQDHPLALERGEAALMDPPPGASSDESSLAPLRADISSSTVFASERLNFREVLSSDIWAFEKYMLSDHYLRHMPMEPATLTKDYVAAQVDRHVRNQSQKPRTGFVLVAVDKHSGEFVGEGGLSVYSFPARRGGVGWGVAPAQTGKGFATEIGRTLLRLAFETLNLHRVEAQCRSENHASRRIMAKLVIREEGVLRDNMFIRGEWWSTVQAAILSTEWRGATNAE